MKILSLDVSGNYSSISLLNDDEINTFTQTHDRKERPDWDKLFARIGFDSKQGFDELDGLALLVVLARTQHSESPRPF